jgi:hypothetical protein
MTWLLKERKNDPFLVVIIVRCSAFNSIMHIKIPSKRYLHLFFLKRRNSLQFHSIFRSNLSQPSCTLFCQNEWLACSSCYLENCLDTNLNLFFSTKYFRLTPRLHCSLLVSCWTFFPTQKKEKYYNHPFSISVS